MKHNIFELRCPNCHDAVEWHSGTCKQCGRQYLDENGYPSFVDRAEADAERGFYDQSYHQTLEREARLLQKRQVEHAAALWNNPWNPHEQVIWKRMADIGNKRVILLGNGESEKELAFLKLNPAALVYSDLSSTAVKIIFERYDLSSYGETLWGAAIDALSLPCHDESIDFVYGYAMVHHIPNVQLFLTEVYRVLRRGGECVFLDDAFAPLWQYAKLTVLRPLMRYSHRRSGISPEDLRFTMSGGFRTKELTKMIKSLGGQPWFERTGFFTYLWSRAVEKLLPTKLNRVFASSELGRCLATVDRVLAPLLRANYIRLAWGFRKE